MQIDHVSLRAHDVLHLTATMGPNVISLADYRILADQSLSEFSLSLCEVAGLPQ